MAGNSLMVTYFRDKVFHFENRQYALQYNGFTRQTVKKQYIGVNRNFSSSDVSSVEK